MVIDHYTKITDSVRMAFIQFFVCGVISMIAMFIFEQPDIKVILSAWLPIAYAGVLSSGVAYTFQFIAQKLICTCSLTDNEHGISICCIGRMDNISGKSIC